MDHIRICSALCSTRRQFSIYRSNWQVRAGSRRSRSRVAPYWFDWHKKEPTTSHCLFFLVCWVGERGCLSGRPVCCFLHSWRWWPWPVLSSIANGPRRRRWSLNWRVSLSGSIAIIKDDHQSINQVAKLSSPSCAIATMTWRDVRRLDGGSQISTHLHA